MEEKELKRQREIDFIKKEFIANLDEELFTITEDDDNYYVMYKKETELMSFFKPKMEEFMKTLLDDPYLGNKVIITEDNDTFIKDKKIK